MAGILFPLIYVFAFVAVVLFAQAVADLMFSRRDRKDRVNRRLTMMDQGMSREEVYTSLVRKGAAAPARSDARLAQLYDKAALYCSQAGLAWSPARGLGIVGAVAAVLWLVALSLASSSSSASPLLNSALSLVGALSISAVGVWLWVRRLRNRRLKQIEEQLPLALDIINRAIRAGHPVISAVQLASEELRDPLGSEFGIIVDETTYGMDFREALANFAHRTGSSDAHFFAVSVAIQSDTGGNLAEILSGLATVIRGRTTLGKRVRALASEGRASGVLLSILPVLTVFVQMLINPTVYSSKFSDPVFWPIIFATALIYLSGWAMVHRIINFRY